MFALTLALSTQAATLPPGALVLPESASEFVSPAVLVGFNPQPEPPGLWLDLAEAPGRVVAERIGSELETILAWPAAGVKRMIIPAEACGMREDIVVHPPDPGMVAEIGEACVRGPLVFDASLADGTHWTFEVSISTPEGLDPASIVGFNPQPEPPGREAGFNPQPEPPAMVGLAIRYATRPESVAFEVTAH